MKFTITVNRWSNSSFFVLLAFPRPFSCRLYVHRANFQRALLVFRQSLRTSDFTEDWFMNLSTKCVPHLESFCPTYIIARGSELSLAIRYIDRCGAKFHVFPNLLLICALFVCTYTICMYSLMKGAVATYIWGYLPERKSSQIL